MSKLSVVLATYNEERNIGRCLESVRGIADEIVVVDGSSIDETVKIAKDYNAKVIITNNPPIFHINKQKALDMARFEWILQLDADEFVSPQLADEIRKVINLSEGELEKYQANLKEKKLFLRHQALVEKRDVKVGEDEGTYAGFFIPRRNYFLGKFLRYGGTYPDGVIRLVKKGKAHFPCKSVHEQIVVKGKVGWLENPIFHYDSPTFRRYLERNSRYIDLIASDMKDKKVKKDLFQFLNYVFFKPIYWFLLTQIRHKGILDGWQGIIFSFFSALRFPRAYFRYLKKV